MGRGQGLLMKIQRGDILYADLGIQYQGSMQGGMRPVVVRIFECKARGMGNASIAKMLNEEGIVSPMRYKYEKGLTKNKRYAESLWNDGTIAAMIVNPVYIGDMEQGIQKEAMYMGIRKHKPQKSGRIYVEGTHEPILSRELFDRVQNLIEERKQKVIADRKKYANVQRKDNIFKHILFCGDCGGRLNFRRKARNASDGVKVSYDYYCPNSDAFADELKAFVELTEGRKEEVTCMRQAV